MKQSTFLRFGGVVRILDFLLERFAEQNDGMDLRQDEQAMQRLLEASEKAKVELSSLNEALKRSSTRFLAMSGSAGEDLRAFHRCQL